MREKPNKSGIVPREYPDKKESGQQAELRGRATRRPLSGVTSLSNKRSAMKTKMSFRRYIGAIHFAAALIWATAPLAAAAPVDELQRFSRTELHMGVEFEVVLYSNDARLAEQALAKAMARIAALDRALSDYDPESELSKLSETSTVPPVNTTGNFPAVKVSDELWTVLAASQEISQQSQGAFDVTVGPLTKLWRRARRWKELPDPESLAAAKASVGWEFLNLDPQTKTVQLRRPNMRLDLGGIAKGYA